MVNFLDPDFNETIKSRTNLDKLSNLDSLSRLNNISLESLREVIKIESPSQKAKERDWRIIILGPGGSGKDTLAASLAKYVSFVEEPISYVGSTSLAMLPEVFLAFKAIDPIGAREYEIYYDPGERGEFVGLELWEEYDLIGFYEARRNCRPFWYNVIAVYRELDPFYMINKIDADIFVGSRDFGEIDTIVKATKDVMFVVCKEGTGHDPTWTMSSEETFDFIDSRYSDRINLPSYCLFEYSDDSFLLGFAVMEVAQEIESALGLNLEVLKQDGIMIRHGVRYDNVINGRYLADEELD